MELIYISLAGSIVLLAAESRGLVDHIRARGARASFVTNAGSSADQPTDEAPIPMKRAA